MQLPGTVDWGWHTCDWALQRFFYNFRFLRVTVSLLFWKFVICIEKINMPPSTKKKKIKRTPVIISKFGNKRKCALVFRQNTPKYISAVLLIPCVVINMLICYWNSKNNSYIWNNPEIPRSGNHYDSTSFVSIVVKVFHSLFLQTFQNELIKVINSFMTEVPNIYKPVYWFANQWNGFYMIGSSAIKELTAIALKH